MFQTNHGSLKGKTVLITGCGIGESIASSFHAQGSKVVILNYNAEPGRALAKELGKRVHFEHNDVRNIPAL
jgi:NAD(P)-dependent dehydrogenase (short-subunit alcohol dehydrogenase family)